MDKCRVESETNEYLESLKEDTTDYHALVEEILDDMDRLAEVYPELPQDTLEALFNHMQGKASNLVNAVYEDVYKFVRKE